MGCTWVEKSGKGKDSRLPAAIASARSICASAYPARPRCRGAWSGPAPGRVSGGKARVAHRGSAQSEPPRDLAGGPPEGAPQPRRRLRLGCAWRGPGRPGREHLWHRRSVQQWTVDLRQSPRQWTRSWMLPWMRPWLCLGMRP
eukprot:scaffold7371_cov121-Isochrysis_galbana.AAC.6